jgi:hypothetical protein
MNNHINVFVSANQQTPPQTYPEIEFKMGLESPNMLFTKEQQQMGWSM